MMYIAAPEIIVCYSHTVENNLGIHGSSRKYMKQKYLCKATTHVIIKYFKKKCLITQLIWNYHMLRLIRQKNIDECANKHAIRS